MGFEEWMIRVDQEVGTLSGLSVHDLGESYFFHDHYDDGTSPRRMAVIALEENGFGT